MSAGLKGGTVARAYRYEIATGRRELWKEFSLPDSTGITGIGCSGITPDGKSFVFTYSQTLSDLYLVDGLR